MRPASTRLSETGPPVSALEIYTVVVLRGGHSRLFKMYLILSLYRCNRILWLFRVRICKIADCEHNNCIAKISVCTFCNFTEFNLTKNFDYPFCSKSVIALYSTQSRDFDLRFIIYALGTISNIRKLGLDIWNRYEGFFIHARQAGNE